MLLLRLRSSIALRASRAFSPSLARSVSCTGSCASFSTNSSASDGSQPPVHVPVLLHETVAALSRNVSDASKPRYFVDGTAGFGGHSRAILQHFPEAKLLCIDRDPEVLSIAQANLAKFQGRVSFQSGSYAELATHLNAAAFPNEVDGILVDLGANSFHFDAARRGFSVLNDGPLDMRFNQRDTSLPTAGDAVNKLSEVQLTKIFRDYGEERLAKEFAKAIVREREERGKVFETTRDLGECIERISNMWKSGDKGKKKKGKRTSKMGSTHPATRCFQALRIYVNDELYHVENGVKQLVNHLAPNGRLVTIAFHSLEDRPIKDLFRELDKKGRVEDDDEDDEWEDKDFDEDDDEDDEWEDKDFDEDEENIDPLKNKRFCLPRRKATKATDDEIAINSRSRSARLRCIERIQ